VFVGDPLYRPFGKSPDKVEFELLENDNPDIEWFRLLGVNQGLASGAPAKAAIDHLLQFKETSRSPVLQEKLGELYVALGQAEKAKAAYSLASQLSKSSKQKQRIMSAMKQLNR